MWGKREEDSDMLSVKVLFNVPATGNGMTPVLAGRAREARHDNRWGRHTHVIGSDDGPRIRVIGLHSLRHGHRRSRADASFPQGGFRSGIDPPGVAPGFRVVGARLSPDRR
ncbi:hypothetical protein GCM10027065_28850 [Rhodanobacter koreensis]